KSSQILIYIKVVLLNVIDVLLIMVLHLPTGTPIVSNKKEDSMFKKDLMEIGYQECDLHYTDGKGLVMEVLGKWFQTHVNPKNLQISQVELKSVKDIQSLLNYEPIRVETPNP